MDTAPLAVAMARLNALQMSACELATEASKAAESAARAADEVRTNAAAVIDHDAKRLMSELLAARDLFWTLTEQASGFFLLDERRSGGPRFAKLREEPITTEDTISFLLI